MEQGTQEWFETRLGKITASKIADVMAKGRNGPSVTRKNYMADLVAEILTGNPKQSFSNAAMEWGTETEPQARLAYEIRYSVDVEQVGFIPHLTIKSAGASPDGLVGQKGLVEFKCPNTATHLEALLGSPILRQYRLQMQFQMECTARDWCDFVSFDPRLPASMQLHVQRIEYDPNLSAEINDEVKAFSSELDAKVSSLRAQYEKLGVA